MGPKPSPVLEAYLRNPKDPIFQRYLRDPETESILEEISNAVEIYQRRRTSKSHRVPIVLFALALVRVMEDTQFVIGDLEELTRILGKLWWFRDHLDRVHRKARDPLAKLLGAAAISLTLRAVKELRLRGGDYSESELVRTVYVFMAMLTWLEGTGDQVIREHDALAAVVAEAAGLIVDNPKLLDEFLEAVANSGWDDRFHRPRAVTVGVLLCPPPPTGDPAFVGWLEAWTEGVDIDSMQSAAVKADNPSCEDIRRSSAGIYTTRGEAKKVTNRILAALETMEANEADRELGDFQHDIQGKVEAATQQSSDAPAWQIVNDEVTMIPANQIHSVLESGDYQEEGRDDDDPDGVPCPIGRGWGSVTGKRSYRCCYWPTKESAELALKKQKEMRVKNQSPRPKCFFYPGDGLPRVQLYVGFENCPRWRREFSGAGCPPAWYDKIEQYYESPDSDRPVEVREASPGQSGEYLQTDDEGPVIVWGPESRTAGVEGIVWGPFWVRDRIPMEASPVGGVVSEKESVDGERAAVFTTAYGPVVEEILELVRSLPETMSLFFDEMEYNFYDGPLPPCERPDEWEAKSVDFDIDPVRRWAVTSSPGAPAYIHDGSKILLAVRERLGAILYNVLKLASAFTNEQEIRDQILKAGGVGDDDRTKIKAALDGKSVLHAVPAEVLKPTAKDLACPPEFLSAKDQFLGRTLVYARDELVDLLDAFLYVYAECPGGGVHGEIIGEFYGLACGLNYVICLFAKTAEKYSESVGFWDGVGVCKEVDPVPQGRARELVTALNQNEDGARAPDLPPEFFEVDLPPEFFDYFDQVESESGESVPGTPQSLGELYRDDEPDFPPRSPPGSPSVSAPPRVRRSSSRKTPRSRKRACSQKNHRSRRRSRRCSRLIFH